MAELLVHYYQAELSSYNSLAREKMFKKNSKYLFPAVQLCSETAIILHVLTPHMKIVNNMHEQTHP